MFPLRTKRKPLRATNGGYDLGIDVDPGIVSEDMEIARLERLLGIANSKAPIRDCFQLIALIPLKKKVEKLPKTSSMWNLRKRFVEDLSMCFFLPILHKLVIDSYRGLVLILGPFCSSWTILKSAYVVMNHRWRSLRSSQVRMLPLAWLINLNFPHMRPIRKIVRQFLITKTYMELVWACPEVNIFLLQKDLYPLPMR
jgi:hypothetical protein